MSDPALDIRALRHQYGRDRTRATVLDGIDMQAAPGEVIALVGQSGSGKSTLLNLVGALEPVQQGELRLFGENIAGLNERARTALRRERIGFVYQAFNLIPTLSVADNVALPLVLARQPTREREARVGAMLASVGLGHQGAAFPDRLSGGEQQRVAIARALVHRPRLLLADEPTGNLDAVNGQQVLDLLLGLAGGAGATLLVVTHSRHVASTADRVLRLHGGRLVSVDADTLGDGSDAW